MKTTKELNNEGFFKPSIASNKILYTASTEDITGNIWSHKKVTILSEDLSFLNRKCSSDSQFGKCFPVCVYIQKKRLEGFIPQQSLFLGSGSTRDFNFISWCSWHFQNCQQRMCVTIILKGENYLQEVKLKTIVLMRSLGSDGSWAIIFVKFAYPREGTLSVPVSSHLKSKCLLSSPTSHYCQRDDKNTYYL